MPSPIQTGGFSVQAQPGINYPDPRLMAPALGGIIPAAGQGLGVAGDFFQMQESAQARPIRQQLAALQLQEAQNRIAMAPLEQQLAALRLGEAQQQAAVPEVITENIKIMGGSKELRPVDPSARFEDFRITEEFTPRERVVSGREIMAGGSIRPFERRETLATAEEIQRQNRKDDIALMAEERRVKEQSESSNLRSQRLALDIEKARSPDFKKDRQGLDSNGRLVTVLFNSKTGEELLIPTDLVPIKSESEAMQIINALTGGGEPKTAPKNTAAGTPSFATIEEADAAAALEGWKGTRKIMVGGRPATWQE